MNELVNELISRVHDLWLALVAYLSEPWVTYQLSIIVAAIIIAKLLKPRIKNSLETPARKIKGKPKLLRVIVVLLRRIHHFLFMLMMGLSLLVLHNLTLPSRSFLISGVFKLSLAWVLISSLSIVIRSRTIARLVAFVGWVYASLYIFGITDKAAAFMDSIGFEIGDAKITVLLIVKFIVVMSITLWLGFTLGTFLERRIQNSEELTPSLRVLLGKIVKSVLVVIAVVVATSELGIDLTAFTIFSGALGVGLGFGLQKVVSNFISGIIILLDRSIKPGDTISLGETFGWIRELSARFVSVVTRDGREHLIPNEDFITQKVINWSFSNDLIRLDVPFGVSYKSDPHAVSAMAIEAAASVPRVLTSNKPVCWMTDFGDSSIDFVLRFWISDPKNGLTNIRGLVLLALWDTFKLNHVEIPYPHRQIIMSDAVQVTGPNPEVDYNAGRSGTDADGT
jgi:small-conductance mechanosensitive channel